MNTLDLFKQLTIRDEVGLLLNRIGLVGKAVEIGVLYGAFTEAVLRKWNGQVYYCVDTWRAQPQNVYREKHVEIDYEGCFRQVLGIADRDDRVCIIRKESVKAARFIDDGSLDWVYIDANHAYEPVLADMDAWWPKLKPGGVFSGHDYGLDTNWPNWCEVKPAVDRWMAEHNVPFVVDRHGSSWWSIKCS